MKKIIALGGSNSKKSINKALAYYTAGLLENIEVIEIDLNDFNLPLYGIDRETEQGFPEDAQRLNAILEEVDGLVISLAEHNGSYTVAFKNTFDWLSRIDKNVWKDKPMLLMATSPGKRGAASVLETAKTKFPRLGGNIIADFSLPSFHDNFSESGLSDEALQTELMQKIGQFQKAI